MWSSASLWSCRSTRRACLSSSPTRWDADGSRGFAALADCSSWQWERCRPLREMSWRASLWIDSIAAAVVWMKTRAMVIWWRLLWALQAASECYFGVDFVVVVVDGKDAWCLDLSSLLRRCWMRPLENLEIACLCRRMRWALLSRRLILVWTGWSIDSASWTPWMRWKTRVIRSVIARLSRSRWRILTNSLRRQATGYRPMSCRRFFVWIMMNLRRS